MSIETNNEEVVELTYEERISACDALAAELKAKGIKAERWVTPAKGGNSPGVGVALYADDGEQQANVTVDGKSTLRVRLVLESLPGTALAKKFAQALKISASAFIPDGKFCKSTDAFGSFRKYTKRGA